MSFTIGVNLPWIRYGGDFGANAWRPTGGISAGDTRDAADRTLADIAASGATVVRWFLFCDGRAGLATERGRLVGLDGRVLADADTALSLASAHGLQVCFVLFDFLWCRRGREVNGVTLGGRRRMLAHERARHQLLETVVGPIVSTFGRHRAIWAWDIINEPEWVTLGVGTLNPGAAIAGRAMRAFIDEAASAIHTRADQPVTVGLASARGCRLVAHAALDFYQVHWYDRLDRRSPIDRDVPALGLDRPVVLGEFPTRGSARTADALFDLARTRGYAGAFAWSWLADDKATDVVAARRAIVRAAAAEAPRS